MKTPAARLRLIAVTQLNIFQGLVREGHFSAKDIIVAQSIAGRFNPLLQRHLIKITNTFSRPSRKYGCNSSGAINIREEIFTKEKKNYGALFRNCS